MCCSLQPQNKMKRPRSVVADVRGTNGHRDRTLEVGLLVVCATVPGSRCYPTTAQQRLKTSLPRSSAPSRSTEPRSPSTSAKPSLTVSSSAGDLYTREDAARLKGAVIQASAGQVAGLIAAWIESSLRGRSEVVAPTEVALALWPPLQRSMEKLRGWAPWLSTAVRRGVRCCHVRLSCSRPCPSRVDSRSGDHRPCIRGAAWESGREPVLPWNQVPSRR